MKKVTVLQISLITAIIASLAYGVASPPNKQQKKADIIPLRKPHFIVNDDGQGIKIMSLPHTEVKAKAPIEYLKGTIADCLSLCVGNGVASYDSKVLQTIYELYDKRKARELDLIDDAPVAGKTDLAYNLYRRGIDYLPILIRRTHELDKVFYGSFRMNDSHHKSDPNGYFADDFFKNNPQYRLWGETDALSYYDAAMDYAFPEVRRRKRESICEFAAKYDVDGIELDFSRNPYLFQPDEAWANREILTEFIRKIRKKLDKIGAERGRPVGLMIRTVFGQDRLAHGGMDLQRWISEGLMDFLVMTNLSNDCNLDVQPWLGLCQKKGIAFYAAAEGGPWIDKRNFHDIFPNPDSPPHNWVFRQTPEDKILRARAVAQNMLAQGVDGIYLFNQVPRPIANEYFDPLGPRPEQPMSEWGSLETLRGLDKQYIFWKGLPIYVEALRPPRYHQTIQFTTRGSDIGKSDSQVVLRFRQMAKPFPHVAKYEQSPIVEPGYVTYTLNGKPIPEERIERKRQKPGRINSGFKLSEHELIVVNLPGTAIRSGQNSLSFEIPKPKEPQERDPYVYIYQLEVDVRFDGI